MSFPGIMTPLDLLILALATWYISFIVTAPRFSGPFGVLAWLRARKSLEGVTSCIFCFAPWCMGLLLLIWHTPVAPVVIVFAGAGGALMLASYSGAHHL